MRVAAGADHAGLALKERLVGGLRQAGHEVQDLGTHSPESTDYPDWAAAVARRVAEGGAERGLLVCGTGVGMAIAANKIAGARAAACNHQYLAEMARRHNDANILCLGARDVGVEHAAAILATFLATPFEGGRHEQRLARIRQLEREREPEGRRDPGTGAGAPEAG